MQKAAIDDGSGQQRRRVLIVLPFDMSARNFISSPVARWLAADSSLEVTMVSREAGDREKLEQLPGSSMSWAPMLRPFRASFSPGLTPLRRLRLLLADVRLGLGHYLFLMLAYRFNSMNGFRGFSDRIRQSRPMRRLAFKEGLPSRRWLGLPFPRSPILYSALKRLYFSSWQRHPLVAESFDRVSPHVAVVTHLQSSTVTPYVLEAHARGVPILGVNGSWDQPTTKGPMLPHVDDVLAQGQQVVEDLVSVHGFPRDRIEIVGWPQMDVYAQTAGMQTRSSLLSQLGLAPDARYILFAAYAERLGRHEPELCQTIHEALERGSLGSNVKLLIRCHPLDMAWKQRLGHLHSPPTTIVEPPQLGHLDHLKALIKHAEVVIASAGTMNLDAVALDTPSIALALEEADVPYFDRSARRYDMEHVAAMMRTGGIRKVRSKAELIDAIRGYTADRTCDADGRARLREQILAPLDGKASERIAASISRFAHRSALAARKVGS